MATLLDLREGESGTIVKVRGRGAFRKRITEMGFIRGKEVMVVKAAPLQDPIEYKILGYNVSLRKREAALIEVVRIQRHPPGRNTPATSPASQ
jgi:ferrous iron transport protein B